MDHPRPAGARRPSRSGDRTPVQAAAAAVRLRRLRLQSLLAEHHALPVVLLHRRARASDRQSRRRPTWSRRSGTGSPISSPACWSTGSTTASAMGRLLVAGAVPLGLTLRAHLHAADRERRLGDREHLRRAPAVPHGLCRRERALSRDDRADQRGRRRPRVRRRHADAVRDRGGGGRRACARFRVGKLAHRIERCARPISAPRSCSPSSARRSCILVGATYREAVQPAAAAARRASRQRCSASRATAHSSRSTPR